ncbi:MAG: S8 family serine peptidase, partial [Solirubrobacteraceae bacterium]|nr:S8 family serine peptidase [Solirubrobacteraceae bacterium]
MRRLRSAAALLVLLALGAAPARAEVVPGEVVVRFEADAGQRAVTQALDAVGPEAVERIPLPDTRVLTLPPGEAVEDAVARLERAPGVAWAEPNHVVRAVRVPDDQYFDLLWGLRNLTAPGVDIGATAGWDVLTEATAAVGVADTGIRQGHPDLFANVDVALSRDFVGDDPFIDGDGHGTHVAGTIGAVGDNGIGVAGVAWRARLAALRVLDATGSGTTADVAAGFAWAGARGLQVVNASLGGGEYSQVMRDAIAGAPDTLFVVAAGNAGADVDATPTYPCAYPEPNILCVAAIAPDGTRASFSNYGAASVDVGAPGVDIASTYVRHTWPFDDLFATGLAGRWTSDGWTWTSLGADGGVVRPGDGAGSYGPGLDQTLTMVDPVQIAGRRGCTLWLDHQSSVPLANGWIAVEVSSDGGPYTPVGILGPVAARRLEAFDLPDPAGATRVRLRFRTVASLPQPPGPAPAVHGVAVRCLDMGSVTYAYSDGTSMASPFVAGIAALVRTRRPGLSAVQARQAILESVKPLAS